MCSSSGCVCSSSLSTRKESCSMPVGAVTQSFLTLAGTIILSTTDINYPQWYVHPTKAAMYTFSSIEALVVYSSSDIWVPSGRRYRTL